MIVLLVALFAVATAEYIRERIESFVIGADSAGSIPDMAVSFAIAVVGADVVPVVQVVVAESSQVQGTRKVGSGE